jgi:hypothetical protein
VCAHGSSGTIGDDEEYLAAARTALAAVTA